MQNFLNTIPTHTTTDLDLQHYTCVGGFPDRDGDKKECAIMQDTRILCKSAQARLAVLKRLENLTATVQKTEKEAPTGVLTYMGFECLDNETGVRIYGRFESRDAMEGFLRRKDVLGFWMESKGDVAGMECRGYLPNGKGWLHRGGDGVMSGRKL